MHNLDVGCLLFENKVVVIIHIIMDGNASSFINVKCR